MQLDYLKEQVAYLKLWQGIVVITDISLAGWAMSAADEAGRTRIVLAILGIMLLGFGALALHRRIAKHIDLIGKL
jgi:hypothetical protein